MAMTENTVKYAFESRVTSLATDTTLGTATRHDFTSKTLTIAENTSRAFLAVILTVRARDVFTAATSFTGMRVGIKLGAVAFDDVDFTNAQGNSGDHEEFIVKRDVTSYFGTNFGSGTTQTCQVGVAVSTSAAANVTNISAVLDITYEFDDASATTRTKTVPIGIQSHHTTLTTSHVEVGTTGGTTNAPANQIPALDTYLEESSKTFTDAFVEVLSNDMAGASTTDLTVFYQIDSTTEVQRATLEQGLASSCFYHDIWTYPTGTHSTASAHAFKARADVTTRMQNLGGVLWVTYTYAASTTRANFTRLMGFYQVDDGQTFWLNGDGTAGNANVFRTNVDIQEPGTITLKQAAIVGMIVTTATSNALISAGAQAERTYNVPSNVPYCGPVPFVHRPDHNSGWTLARGKSVLTFALRQSSEARLQMQGYILLTYSADVPAAGVSAASKTTSWIVGETNTSATTTRDIASGTPRVPKINAANYAIVNGLAELTVRNNAAVGVAAIQAKQQSSEWDAAGWMTSLVGSSTQGEFATNYFFQRIGSWFNDRTGVTGRANVETARAWRIEASVAAVSTLVEHISYHTITYAVSGTISNTAGAGTGLTVDIFRADTDEKVASATTTAGAFSTVVYDDTTNYYAVVIEDSTHKGRTVDLAVPSSAFNIDVAPPGGGGGGDTSTGSRWSRGWS
jgi:hypothetical protein